MKRTDHGHSQHWVRGENGRPSGWDCDPDCHACSQETLFGDPSPVQPHFSGSDYVEPRDGKRLTGQVGRVYDIMSKGSWMTVTEVRVAIAKRFPGDLDPETSISAQLRNLRKKEFGSNVVTKRQRGEQVGLYEYRLEVKA
jgi:hypothetical protein